MIVKLKYGNTNTYFIQGSEGGLLVDTDYAGTMPGFYRAIKANGIRLSDITCVLATHYHPDHMGLVRELMQRGVQLLLVDIQKPFVHFSDEIFRREKQPAFEPVDEGKAITISCEESRAFLEKTGIRGEIIHTPSHSGDSVSLILDSGECFVGDLEPREYLDAYEDNAALAADWERIMAHRPKRICYGHANEKKL